MYSLAPAEVVTYVEEYDIADTMDEDGWWSLASAMYSRYGALPTGVSAGATSTDRVASSTSKASAGTVPATSTLSDTSKAQSVTKSSAGASTRVVVVTPRLTVQSWTTVVSRPLPKTITTTLTLPPTSTTVEQTETATETYVILASGQAACDWW
jgi:hypothetical protein